MKHFLSGFLKAAGKTPEVSTVAIIKNGKILFGKRNDNGKWTNPGGHLEGNEDPLDGAIREAYEESGIKLNPKQLKFLTTESVISPEGKKYIIHAYLAKVGDEISTSVKGDPDGEVTRWHWVNMPLSKEILENLHSPKNVLLKALGLQRE